MQIIFFICSDVSALAGVKTCTQSFGDVVMTMAYSERNSVRYSSILHFSSELSRIAEKSARDFRVQKEFDSLIEREVAAYEGGSTGNHSNGMGRRHLGNNYFELRGSAGGRVFVRIYTVDGSKKKFHVVIVGKSSKDLENRAFGAMRDLYPDFPSPRGEHMSD